MTVDHTYSSELGIGSNSEGLDVRSVGNTAVLKETALIEAFNLKAAIEYEMKNCKVHGFSTDLSQTRPRRNPWWTCLPDWSRNLILTHFIMWL